MESRNCFREIIKHRALKKLFLAIKHNNLEAAISLKFLHIC